MAAAGTESSSAARAAAAAESSAMLQFPLTVASAASADDTEGLRDGDCLNNDYEPVLELQRIEHCVAHTDEACAQLAAVVQNAQAAGGCSDLRSLGSFLRSRHGYLVSLRHANASKQPKAYLRQLRHEFLVVRGLPGLAGGEEVLIDVGLRDHFFLSAQLATPWYTKLLDAVPQVWVGPACALVPVVGLLAAGMRLCFRQAGVPLPPWREARAMISMWLPEVASDEPLAVVPLPDPALRRLLAPWRNAPFRTAVREAAAEAEAVAATATTAAPATPAAAGGRDGGGGSGMPAAPAATHAHQQHQQQTAGGSSRHTSLPPLPRQQQPAGITGADHKQQPTHRPLATSHVPDVPRKIVVGFPMATLPLRDQQLSGRSSPPGAQQDEQQEQQHQQGHSSQAPPPAGASSSALVGGAQQTGAPQPPQHEAHHAHQQQQQQLCDGGAARQQHLASDAKAPAAAAAAAAAPAPAFTSTAGIVVVATAGGRSPGVVINKAWLQQQLAGPGSPAEALQGTSADHASAAAGSPAVHAAECSAGSHKAGGLGGGGGAAGGGAAAGVGSGGASSKRQKFKTLDQLLPRMRTVRLGAG